MKKLVYAILVLAAPVLAQLTVNPLPSREFGQPTLINPNTNASSPNLVVGQELYNPSAIAFDTSVTPPRVYVVDTGNNRVLGWSNANNVSQGTFADLVLGQPASASGGFDLTATLPWGPGTSNPEGLNTPTGVAVDAAGNVYVSDSANNRILRFATPYKQQPGNLIVDLVIGQKTISGDQANQGNQNPSSTTLYLGIANSQGAIPAGLAVDGSGNLWAADPGNQRVLMFPAANLTANNASPAATVALGQTNFNSNQTNNQSQTNGGILYYPTSVAVDTNGNVYVTDAFARVLAYFAPVQLGQTASRVLGIPPANTQGQPPTYPNQSSLGSVSSGGTIQGSPQGVFVLNGASGVSVFVADSPQNRVVRYDSMVVPTGGSSPLESGVVGQNGYGLGAANQGLPGGLPTNQTFNYPVAGAIRPDNSEMWVVDQANHRVVAFTSQGGGVYNSASRVLGQKDFTHNGANLLEGRELWLSANGSLGGGIVVDSTSCSAPGSATITCSSPPHLYIADTQNNRVLGFKDARLVGVDARTLLTQTADIVIGQIDPSGGNQPQLYSLINSPNNTIGQPTATGLYHPVGLAVDAHGNLWVADSGNSRVVRFPAPFAQAPGAVQTATVVLGQNSLTSPTNPTVSEFTMVQPYGLALFANGSLAVSDPAANRILVYNISGGDFTSGQGASYVVGQTGFSQSATGTSNSQLNGPRHIAVDSSDRLYVCDFNNNRLVIYSKPTANTPAATFATPVGSIGQPIGIIVSFATGLTWITTGNGVVQLPEFQTLQLTYAATQALQPLVLENTVAFGALAVTLDPFDDVIVADSANRVTFYFGQMFYRNTASFAAGVQSAAAPAPTMLIELAREGSNFQLQTSYTGGAANLAPPWPTQLNNVQLTVNGIPAPIFRIDPAVIFAEIPNEAPTSGPADFVVSNPATGQILAAATFNMQAASPGIFTANSEGTGPAAANNYDTNGNALAGAAFINSPSNPVAAGAIIGLWLTGAGNVPGLPADGTAPGGAFYTPVNPVVYINAQVATVVGSAISPQYPGLWQVNVRVPANTPPSSSSPIPIYVEVSMDGYASNIGGNPQGYTNGAPGPDIPLTGSDGLLTYIYVK